MDEDGAVEVRSGRILNSLSRLTPPGEEVDQLEVTVREVAAGSLGHDAPGFLARAMRLDVPFIEIANTGGRAYLRWREVVS